MREEYTQRERETLTHINRRHRPKGYKYRGDRERHRRQGRKQKTTKQTKGIGR